MKINKHLSDILGFDVVQDESYVLSDTNNLAVCNPELAKEWHPTKNGKLTPFDVTPGCGKNVWWKCKNGHDWIASIDHRCRGRGCPFCVGKKICKDNCLATKNPELAKEWHPTKNGKLTPNDVTPGSNKKVWWKCKNGHSFFSSIANRKTTKCPYCSNQRICDDNCLTAKNFELAKEWHPTKNGKLTPENVAPSSGKVVWWKCKDGHEWKASINSRNRKNGRRGCPYCSGKRVCNDNCLATKNPDLASQWNTKTNGELTPHNITNGSKKKVWWKCKNGHEWEATVASRNAGRNCPYCTGRKICKDNCLSTKNSELAKEWHPTKNGKLTPKDVMPNSGKKVWWRCKNGHEFVASLLHRSQGNGCPYCSGKRACDDNCLATKSPKLASEWSKEKNGKLTPHDVTSGSEKSVWWVCKSGHEWKAPICNRSGKVGRNCPYCSNKKVCKDNCLATLEPELAKEWHPTKNGKLTPENVVPGSKIRVWWRCKNGHEWDVEIIERKNGGCPYCSSHRVCKDNCLSTTNPELALEWDNEKNGELTPDNITRGSRKKVHWVCENGHRFSMRVSHRTSGHGCVYCSMARKRKT